MKLLSWLLLAALLAPDEKHTVVKTIDVGGLKREYRLHVPPSYDKAKPPALVLVFHGGGGNARQQERFSGFSDLSDKEGFIAVYPDAVEHNWNDGRGVETIKSQKDGVDDVAFVKAALDEIARETPFDPKRVFACGISNGAIFSHYLALKADRVAAIGCLVGGIAEPVAKDFKPEKPVSVLIMQGTDDPLVPYDGGAVARNRGRIVSTADAVKTWIGVNGCGEKGETAELPDKDPDDGTRIEATTYTGGKDGTEVVLYKIKGGGHTWPGGAQYLPKAIVGVVSRDLDATRALWDFFAKHPRP